MNFFLKQLYNLKNLYEKDSLFFLYLLFILCPLTFILSIISSKLNFFFIFQSIIDIVSSIFIINSFFENAEPHYLLGTTKNNELALVLTGLSYVIYFFEVMARKNKNYYVIILHLLPGYIGITYILYIHQCGGLIARLLIDGFDYILRIIEHITKFRYTYIIDDIGEIYFFIFRTCFYSIYSVYGCFVMISYWDYIDKVLFVLYIIWISFYLYVHIYLFWKRTRIRFRQIYYKLIQKEKIV